MVYPRKKQQHQDGQATGSSINVQKFQNTGFPPGSLLDVLYKGIVNDQRSDHERIQEITEMFGDIQFALRSTTREFRRIETRMKKQLRQATHDNKKLKDRIENLRYLAGPLPEEDDHPAIWTPHEEDTKPKSGNMAEAPVNLTAHRSSNSDNQAASDEPMPDLKDDLDSDLYEFLENAFNSDPGYPTTPDWDD